MEYYERYYKKQVHSTKHQHKNMERTHNSNLTAYVKFLEQKEEHIPKE